MDLGTTGTGPGLELEGAAQEIRGSMISLLDSVGFPPAPLLVHFATHLYPVFSVLPLTLTSQSLLSLSTEDRLDVKV